jgi:CelD/BcsL family acetyltransferase involved in cellulose biosynthesis
MTQPEEAPGRRPVDETAARTLRTVEALDQHVRLWDRMGANLRAPMLQFAWIRQSALQLGNHSRLHVSIVEGPDGAAAAPLALSGHPIGTLRFLGSDFLHEPMDLIHADSQSLARLAEFLCDAGYPIILRPIFADSPAVAALQAASRRRGRMIVRPLFGTPWIPLDASWEDAPAHLDSGRRSDLRRARRTAERIGPVRFEIITPDLNGLDATLEEAFHVESSGWKGRTGSALERDALRGTFYRKYAAAAAAQGILRICFLRIGERAVAMQIAVVSAGGFWLLKIGYDEEFARCSPGNLLLSETIGSAARSGAQSFEFLGSTEEWTRVWTRHARPCIDLRFYPMRPRGLAAFLVDGPRLAWRALRPRTLDRE